MRRWHAGRVCWLALVLAGCAPPQLVVLLEGEHGPTGAIEVHGGGEVMVLDTPLAASRVDGTGKVHQARLSEREVAARFAGALAAQPERAVSFTLYFEEGETRIVSRSEPVLRRLFAEVAARQVPQVQVTGHTDRVGTVEDNDRLARRRAARVRDGLVERGLDPGMVSAVGRGEREPLVPTDDGVREPRNRRVEVTVR